MRMVPLIIMCAILMIVLGCTRQEQLSNPAQADQGQLSIATTFFPLYSFTAAIAGENAHVFSIIPAGAEPHDYEATPQDIQKLNGADAYVIIGVEFAGVEDVLVSSLQNEVVVIPAGKGIAQISAEE